MRRLAPAYARDGFRSKWMGGSRQKDGEFCHVQWAWRSVSSFSVLKVNRFSHEPQGFHRLRHGRRDVVDVFVIAFGAARPESQTRADETRLSERAHFRRATPILRPP